MTLLVQGVQDQMDACGIQEGMKKRLPYSFLLPLQSVSWSGGL